jgi:hypothetical protein
MMLNENFRDMLFALNDAGVEYLLVNKSRHRLCRVYSVFVLAHQSSGNRNSA